MYSGQTFIYMNGHRQMRKKTLGRILSLIFWTAFFAVFFSLTLSPFSLKHFWLPWTGYIFGYALTVESAAFSPLKQGPNLTIRGLSLQDSVGNEVHLESCEARIRSLSLLAGILDADAVRLNGVRLRISPEAKFTGFDSSLRSRNLKIGAVDFSDVRISVPLPDGSVCDIQTASASISGLIPGADNTLKGTFRLYPGGAAPEAPGIDLRTELRFSLDRNFRPASLLGSLLVSNGFGIWHDRSLSGADGNLLLQAETKSPDGPLCWKASLDLSGIDCTDLIHAEGKGNIADGGARGTMNWLVSIRFSDARVQEMYFPDSPEVRIVPENLRLKDGEFSLEWTPQNVLWTSDGEINLDRLWIRKTESVSNGLFRFHKKVSYSRETKELSLEELTGELKMGDASVSCRNEGVFIFSRDTSGFHVRANNSSLLLEVRSLPAELLNPFSPVNISGGSLSLDYRITANSRRQELTGGMISSLKNISFSGKDQEEIVRSHNMTASCSFHSRGLENIHGLIVDECSLDVTGDRSNRRILHADLSGSWNPRDGGLTLSGRMDLNPYAALGRIVNSPLEDLREIFRRHNAENVWNYCSLSVDFDPARSSDLDFRIRTSFDTLAFLESGIKTPLTLNIGGTVSRDQGGFGTGVKFHTIRLDASELAAVSARGYLSLSGAPSDFHVKVERISPVIPRGLMRFFFRNDLTEEQVSLFYFKSLSGEASFRFDPADRSLRIFPFRAVMIPSDDARSAVTLSLDRDYLCFLSEPEKGEAALSLVAENLPVKWFDFLIPSDASFRFLSGLVQGSAEVTIRNNGADIFLNHEAIVEDYSFAVKNAVWEAGDCRTSGKTCFRDWFTSYDLGKVLLRCLDGTREYLLCTVDGSLALTPEGLTFFNFDISKTSELLPVKLFGDISDHLAVRSFDAVGMARFDGNEDYSCNSFSCKVGIRSLEWEPDEKKGIAFDPLEGNAEIRLETEPHLLRFRDSGIRLVDRSGHGIFHLTMDGTFSSDQETTGPAQCRIRSDGIDGEFLYRVFSRKTKPHSVSPDSTASAVSPARTRNISRNPKKSEGKTRPPEIHRAAPVSSEPEPDRTGEYAVHPPLLPHDESSAIWPFRGEPPAFRIYGYKTELAADLRGLTLTRHVEGALSGKFSASDETLEAKDVLLRINDSTALCSGRVRTAGKNGFEYEGRLSFSGLDVSGLVLAGAELEGKDFPMTDLRGEIQDLNLEIRGRGLSLQNLDKFLKVRLNAHMKNLCVPYEVGTTLFLIRILLLPVQQIPVLVRLLPSSALRRFLQKMVGEGGEFSLEKIQNVEFTEGVIDLESSGTDFMVKKMYFTGPQVKTRVARGCFNPFYNVLRIELLTRFSGVDFPFRLTGTLDNPVIDPSYFLKEFFRKNTFAVGENTLNVLSLGLTGKNDETAWIVPAEPIMPASKDEIKPDGQAPDIR